MTDDEFEERLRTSPFMVQSLHDIIEGSSTLCLNLMELLIAKDVVTVDEVRDMMSSAIRDVSDRYETDLVRFTIEAAARDFEIYASSGLPALQRERLLRRKQEKTSS